MDSRLKRLEAQNSEIKTAMESVTALIEKQLQASLQIKGSIYEVIFLHNISVYHHNTNVHMRYADCSRHRVCKTILPERQERSSC